MRTALIIAVVFFMAANLSSAADNPAAGEQLARVYELNIPRQSLDKALKDFAQQTGLQVARLSDAASDGALVGPVSGTLSVAQALKSLLKAPGLTYKVVDDTTIAVVDPKDSRAANSSFLQHRGEGASQAGEESFRFAQSERASSPSSINPAQSPSSAVEEADRNKVEEIIVTAQKRAERLQDVPISLSVLSSEDIHQRGLVSREDYMRTVPSVLLRDEGVGLAEIVIRGAYGDRFNTGPTVGLYFGDVPLTGYAIGGSTDIKLIDIERVEVLRGPQGSLHGSNALSGAIRYIPREPDLSDFGGQVNVGYSNTSGTGGDNTALEGVVNVPVIEDKLAFRAVGFRHQNAGYIRNIAGSDTAFQALAASVGASSLAVNRDHVGDTEYQGGRVGALWQPVSNLRVGLTYFKQEDSQDDRLFELTQSGPYRRADYQLADVIGGNEDALRVDLDILNATLAYDLGWGTLHSSSAWLEQRFQRKWDQGQFLGSPFRPVDQISVTQADVFVQEVRFASAFQGPLQIVAGLYYENSEQPTAQETYFGGNPAFNPYSRVVLWQTALDRLVTQKAVFGELSYDLTRQIEVTLGARAFEYDSRFWTRTFNSVVVAESASDAESEESDETFKAGLKYKPTENALVYATWSQGFRLGRPLATELIRNSCDLDRDGFLDGSSVPSTLDRIGSDRLDSYELGTKLSVMNGRATLSASAYHNDWADIPIVFAPPGCIAVTTINGGSARARGMEAEGSVQLTESLRVNAGIGYVDSELTATTSLGRSGDRMNFTPDVNGNLGLQYERSIAGKNAFVRGDYLYFGSYYTQTGRRGLRADSYNLVNLRAGFALSERAEINVLVDNVLNSDAFTSVFGPSGVPPGYAVRLRPRTIGAGLSYRF